MLSITLFWLFHLAFSTVVGGYFLWGACQIYDEWTRRAMQNQAKDDERARELSTTDAGPYSAPGAPLNSTLGPAPLNSEPYEEPPSFLVACGINFAAYWSVAIGIYVLGFGLYMSGGGGSPGQNLPHLLWLGPLSAFCTALPVHRVLLQTTPLRAFQITLLLVVPWTAAGIAFGLICLLK